MTLIFGGTGRSGLSLQERISGQFLGRNHCDLRYPEQVKSCLDKYQPTQVVHLAATCGSSNKNRSYEYFYDNILMGVNLFHECIMRDIRIIAVSSSAAYHNVGTPKEGELHNAAPCDYNFSYAFSKRALDAQRRASGYEKCVILYPSNMYGPHDTFGEGCHVIPSLLFRMQKQDSITVQNSDSIRQFLYFDDFSEVIALVLKDDKISGEVNVAPTEGHSIEEVALKLGKIVEYEGEFTFEKGGECKFISSTKLLSMFSEFKFTKLDEGLRNTVKSMDGATR